MITTRFLELIRHSSKKIARMPNQFEQDIAQDYVCNRELYRPDTSLNKVIKRIFGAVALTSLVAFLCYAILTHTVLFSFFPPGLRKMQNEKPILLLFNFSLISNFLVFAVCLRKILIGIIRLYQHYAPEEIRRRCLFKPTCSEYTILVLQKYGVIIGLYKAYVRIFKNCRGSIYSIDYP
jgi:putative component of membrane protein insertase Oxa1/YidC/SpoIIIJ protein YidD